MNNLINQAIEALQGKIRNTPVEYSPKLSTLLGQPVYLKLECLQLTGSFKLRGGFFYLSTLNEAERKRGVAACSAGNHGLGVAYACKELGVPCTIFVPSNVDQAKYEKLVELNAQVMKSAFAGYDDTQEWAKREADKMQVPFISAFDDEKIMAANGGTLAKEVLSQVPTAMHFVLPTSGGGLSSGFSWVVKERNPECKVTICQLESCPSFPLSLKKGKAATYMPATDTLAGGLDGGIGEKCFEVLKSRVDEVALIKEHELKEAVCWFLQNHQYLIEPSSAATLASCLFGHVKLSGPAVIVLSGRNVSYSTLQLLLNNNVA